MVDAADARDTLVIAHRGAWGAAAENTLEAFEEAIAIGADMIEFDVRRTRDDCLIVYHDAHVIGVRTGARRRDELTSKGTTSRPPLLEDVLDLVKARIAVDLELKESGYVEDVIGLLKAFGLDRCLLTSFLDDVVLEASVLAPGLKTGLLVGIESPCAPIRRLRRSRADYLGLDLRLADTRMLTRASAAGVPCVIWTVNHTPAFARYLAHAPSRE